MHGHAHHNHERSVDDLVERGNVEERGDVVIVYKTLDPDFLGDIGGYFTGTKHETATEPTAGVGPPVSAPSRTREETTETKPTNNATTTTEKEAATTTKHTEAHTTTTHETKAETTEITKITQAETTKKQASTTTAESELPITTTSFVTSASPTSETSQDVNNLLAATSTGSASDSAASASATANGVAASEGMTGGAKAGIAIGAIFGVGLIAALIFFFVRKKKRSQSGYENEKSFGGEGLPEGFAASFPPPPPSKPQTPVNAPQLNVRPVTQFAPDLSGTGALNPTTAGTAGAAAGSGAVASRNLTGESPPPTPLSSGTSPNPFSDPVNPFNPAPSPATQNLPSIPGSGAGPSGSAVAGTAVGAAAVGAVAGAAASSRDSNDSDNYQSAESRGHSPTSSTHSSTNPVYAGGAGAAAAAGAMAAGPPPPTNVYRVQMDFNPSMEDELGLRVGALVRLLHEYDDGWALCTRLNGSQQGVAPRTCLSARPVMPRARPPRGPPVTGPDGRPMVPGGPPPAGRFYPQDARPRSPNGPPRPYPGPSGGQVQFPAVPRSMSPGLRGMPRSMSPGPGGRPVPRSMSPGPGGMPVPRSMSPGPGGMPGARSMSPGPYGPPGMQRPMMPVNQRPRSNSASNAAPPMAAPAAPPVPSPLAAAAPAPTSDLPALPGSTPTSPAGSISRKPVPSQDA